MRAWLAAPALVLVFVACAGTEARREDLLVSAASSLTDVFGEVEIGFEREHPGVDVVVNTGGSSLLREQILGGAPVDVFASASPEIMSAVGTAIDGPVEVFARNTLEIAVPLRNPGHVSGLQDFADDSLLIGLCAPGVPCGDYARILLEAAGVAALVDTEEPNVRALLAKLERGELDAGIVYATDIVGNSRVEGVAIPDDLNLPTSYVAAAISNGANPVAASQFVAYLLSDHVRDVLVEHGFAVP